MVADGAPDGKGFWHGRTIVLDDGRLYTLFWAADMTDETRGAVDLRNHASFASPDATDVSHAAANQSARANQLSGAAPGWLFCGHLHHARSRTTRNDDCAIRGWTAVGPRASGARLGCNGLDSHWHRHSRANIPTATTRLRSARRRCICFPMETSMQRGGAPSRASRTSAGPVLRADDHASHNRTDIAGEDLEKGVRRD